jgi:CheY-like chemotaxis protein
MNTKFVSAYIIDQDADLARNMSGILKDLFSKVYFETDTTSANKEIEKLKPAVVLVNLTISQRTQNLELAEIIGRLEAVPLLLGYSDSHEPELLAHALESGFQDLFMKPFDEDIIASKINKFFQHEKTLKHDIAYSVLRPSLPARVKFSIKVTGCDENGITIESEHYLSKGSVINLPRPLSLEISGNEKTEFMITRTWTGDTWSQFFSYAELKVPDDVKTAALRRFITGKSV